MSVNKVILIGNLGKDPLVRYLDNERVVATFTMATSETFTTKTGERRVETEWHNIEMWDSLAKIAEKYLKKGMQVFVEGKIKSESWKDKDGNERVGKKIRVTSFNMLGNRASDSNENEPLTQVPPTVSSNDGDELPF
jgi:single-strand DNA-binding protein